MEIREKIEENNLETIINIKAENELNKVKMMEKLKENLEAKNFSEALDDIFLLQYLIAIDNAIDLQEERT